MEERVAPLLSTSAFTDSDTAAWPGAQKEKPPPVSRRGFELRSLAVTYFRIDKVETSIGAERFHFRVRKGIGWFPLAMAARQRGRDGRVMARPPLIRFNSFRRVALNDVE